MPQQYLFEIYTKAHPAGFPTYRLTKSALRFVKHEALGPVLRFKHASSGHKERGREVDVILPAGAIDRIEKRLAD